MVKSRSISRRVTARASVIALSAAIIAPAGIAAAPAWASLSPMAPVQISGVVQDAATNSVPGACVYPFVSGQFDGISGGAPASMLTVLSGSCTDADGNFSVAAPPNTHQTATTHGLIVVPPNATLAGAIWPLGQGNTVTLGAANAEVTTTVSSNNGGMQQPVPNALVEVYDSADGQVLGVGFSDGGGNATLPVKSAANPADFVQIAGGAPIGLSTSNDLVGGAQISAPSPGASIGAPPIVIPDFTTITGQVTQDGLTPHSGQVVGALCQAGCNSSALGLTDAQGNYSLAVPLNSQVVISAGTQHIPISATTSSVAMPQISTIPAGRVLGNAGGQPTTWVNAGGLTLKPTVTWSWSGGSFESAPDVWQVSTSKATWKSAPTAYTGLTNHLDQSMTSKLAYGSSVCQKVATVTLDSAPSSSNVGSGTTSCFTLPLDDRSLKASSKWKKLKNSKAFVGTVSTAAAAKSTLTLAGVTGNGLTVLWSRATKGGTFTVSVNGKVIKTVGTKGAAATGRLTTIAKKGMKGAKVVITTTSAAPVTIDGLAVTH